MKRYIIISALLITSYVNGQDTVLFNHIDSIVASVDLMASKGKFDTLRSNSVSRDGIAHQMFILKQGREVQKIANGNEKIVFHSGKPVYRQVQGPSSTWTYYVSGENSYLYFRDENKLVTVDTRFLCTSIRDYLRPFRDQINNASY